MTPKMQRIFTWSGIVMMVGFLVGFQIAHFVPPPSPTRSAGYIANYFAHHATAIRAGLFVAACAVALLATWSVAVSLQLKRISPKHSGYAYAELILGALLLVEFLIPIGIWEGLLFRPLAGQEITLRLNDVASLMFVGVVGTAVLEGIVIGVAMLQDPREVPLFPRWLAWFMIIGAIGSFPGGFCVFTKTGPLAWNGAISWWFALTVFALWFIALTWGVLRAISDEERQLAAAGNGRGQGAQIGAPITTA
jgi:hypothetical protein